MKIIPALILVWVMCLGCATNQVAEHQTENIRQFADTKIESTEIAWGNWKNRIELITEGMTSEQVKSILGTPTFGRRKGAVVYWYYSSIGYKCFVKLLNGRVQAIGKSEEGL